MVERPLAGLTMIVVEDDADTIAMLVEYLTLHGALVRPASGARAGLELAQIHRPHAILTDFMLPDADGRWLLRKVRRAPGLEGVPVYGMSGERHDVSAGFNGFFVKPVDLDALVGELAQVRRSSV